ncbi:MAG: GNAT family N-acetyltransferase [Treponemataceae bacterium]|nr:GNAT family N-acetyltransferase [Treponemataceae bacterium]
MIIRHYEPTDCEDVANLFYHTVHTVNAKDYTKEQLHAWATGKIDLEEWNKSLSAHYAVVAVENNGIVGFGDIDKSGYLDRLYVHKDYQRRGIATAICDKLEQVVAADKIVTHASITAKPFFEQRGFKAVKEQQVIRNGIALTNYVMEKQVR